MEKLTKILSAVLLSTVVFIQSVSAADICLTMKGTAKQGAKGVTLLVLNKGTSIQSVTPADVKYINQAEINDDGTFQLNIPFFSQDEYDFYSNSGYTLVNLGNPTKTVFVSDSGTAENTGESAESPITLVKAYNNIEEIKEIVLTGATTYTEAPMHIKNLTIKALNASTVLTLPSDVSLNGDTTFSNLTLSGEKSIFANGYSLKIDENVSSTDRLTVYGGSNEKQVDGDTNITLLGGLYNNVFGGGNGTTATVTGNTNVTLGGNSNVGDSNSDENSNVSPCMVYGGGANASVTGKTNVNIEGNAVVRYVFGAGTGVNGTALDTNININGGEIMNVYGGSESQDTVLTDCDTHVTITGGLAEAIFGGSQNSVLTGHTYVNILGGEVSRRVYTGCYNDVDIGLSGLSIKATWKSDYYVDGTTTLTLAPGVKLNTTRGLSSDNQVNIGVFAGSRRKSHAADEINTIIYLDDCYNECKGYIGEKSSKAFVSLSNWLKNFANYVVKVGKGGMVTGTGIGGEVYIAPDSGNYGAIGGNKYFNQNATITSDTTVAFAKEFNINSMSTPVDTDNGISTTVDVTAENFSNEESPYMIVAVYDNGVLVSCDVQKTPASNANEEFNIDCELEAGKCYIVKAMLWNKNQKPLTASYEITVNK